MRRSKNLLHIYEVNFSPCCRILTPFFSLRHGCRILRSQSPAEPTRPWWTRVPPPPPPGLSYTKHNKKLQQTTKNQFGPGTHFPQSLLFHQIDLKYFALGSNFAGVDPRAERVLTIIDASLMKGLGPPSFDPTVFQVSGKFVYFGPYIWEKRKMSYFHPYLWTKFGKM